MDFETKMIRFFQKYRLLIPALAVGIGLFFSCKKKQKGILDDFPPGKFDGIRIIDKNGIKDTLTGEFSGPYPVGTKYGFRRKPVLDEDQSGFSLYSRSNGLTIDHVNFYIYPDLINAKISNMQVEKNHLSLSFNSGDTLIGNIHLTRK